MGLGRGDLSIADQLVEKHVISDSFSLCYGGMDFGGGAMVLGGINPPSKMGFTHSDPLHSAENIFYVMKELHSLREIEGPYPNYKDICFSGAASDVSQLSKSFSSVDMVFINGKKLSLTPENYLFKKFVLCSDELMDQATL